jgi:hypothetical protein
MFPRKRLGPSPTRLLSSWVSERWIELQRKDTAQILVYDGATGGFIRALTPGSNTYEIGSMVPRTVAAPD